MATTKKATEIQQTSIAKITVKATGKVFYQVKSDSTSEYYQLHLGADGQYHCNCKATKPCKHERALNEILDARIAAEFGFDEEELVVVAAPVTVSKIVLKPTKPVAAKTPVIPAPRFPAVVSSDVPLSERGTLNGNRGFSLLRR
jgi:hypothetical protein